MAGAGRGRKARATEPAPGHDADGEAPDASSTAAPDPGAVVPEADPGADDTPLLSVDDDMQILASNDEWAFRRADKLVEGMPDRRRDVVDRRTEGEVFDGSTLLTLHKMLLHGVLKSLDFPVSTGKEANVFRGTTPRGGYVAVKIFRTNTSTFKHVLQYIQGDERFEGVSGDKRALVHAWTQKEFRNLVRAREVGVDVPEPIKALNNVLVMEYLGVKQGPWPSLKDAAVTDEQMQAVCDKALDDYVTLYNEADLVHADISEYNILVEGAGTAKPNPRFIDVGQAVLKNHPMAQEFLDRDLRNLTAFFRRRGAKADVMAVKARLKHERTMGKDRGEDALDDSARAPVTPKPKRKTPKPARAKRRKPTPEPSP